jgi:hypothetical protein
MVMIVIHVLIFICNVLIFISNLLLYVMFIFFPTHCSVKKGGRV